MPVVVKKSMTYPKGYQYPIDGNPGSGVAARPGATGFASKTAWNFWDYGCSVSFLQSFLTCRETTRLKYIEGWRSRMVSEPLAFGDIGHFVLDRAYDLHKIPDEKKISGLLSDYHKGWVVRNPTATTASKTIESQHRLYGLQSALLPRYFQRWDGDFTGKYSEPNETVRPAGWVQREMWFEIPWQFKDGAKTKLIGRFDGLFIDSRAGNWLFETKFKGQIDEENLVNIVQVDLQVMLYLVVLHHLGHKPKGVLYNVCRRPGERRGKFESEGEFLERVKEKINDPKNRDHYFFRLEVPILANEVKEWEQRILTPMMEDVRAWYEGRLPSYPNPMSYEQKWGLSDFFRPLALGDFSGHVRSERAKAIFEPRQ